MGRVSWFTSTRSHQRKNGIKATDNLAGRGALARQFRDQYADEFKTQEGDDLQPERIVNPLVKNSEKAAKSFIVMAWTAGISTEI